MISFLYVAGIIVFIVAIYGIATWREIRKYDADKEYDGVIASCASHENVLRGSSDAAKAVAEHIRNFTNNYDSDNR